VTHLTGRENVCARSAAHVFVAESGDRGGDSYILAVLREKEGGVEC